jgi:hypothetical protein
LKLAQAKFEPLAGKIPSPKGLVEYLKVFKLSSNPSATKKKKRKQKKEKEKEGESMAGILILGNKERQEIV